jgi:hypothetical protein
MAHRVGIANHLTVQWFTGLGWDADKTDPILPPGAAHPGPAPGPVLNPLGLVSASEAPGVVLPCSLLSPFSVCRGMCQQAPITGASYDADEGRSGSISTFSPSHLSEKSACFPACHPMTPLTAMKFLKMSGTTRVSRRQPSNLARRLSLLRTFIFLPTHRPLFLLAVGAPHLLIDTLLRSVRTILKRDH